MRCKLLETYDSSLALEARSAQQRETKAKAQAQSSSKQRTAEAEVQVQRALRAVHCCEVCGGETRDAAGGTQTQGQHAWQEAAGHTGTGTSNGHTGKMEKYSLFLLTI